MKSNLAEMSAQALAKALKSGSIKSGFLVTGIFPINKATMDAKLGSAFQEERESVTLQQPGIFSQVELPKLHLPNTSLTQLKRQSLD